MQLYIISQKMLFYFETVGIEEIKTKRKKIFIFENDSFELNTFLVSQNW